MDVEGGAAAQPVAVNAGRIEGFVAMANKLIRFCEAPNLIGTANLQLGQLLKQEVFSVCRNPVLNLAAKGQALVIAGLIVASHLSKAKKDKLEEELNTFWQLISEVGMVYPPKLTVPGTLPDLVFPE